MKDFLFPNSILPPRVPNGYGKWSDNHLKDKLFFGLVPTEPQDTTLLLTLQSKLQQESNLGCTPMCAFHLWKNFIIVNL